VGYQIRLDATTVGDNTKIKFMTDGILLREVQT
jgi:HrpA-like RNA helicase